MAASSHFPATSITAETESAQHSPLNFSVYNNQATTYNEQQKTRYDNQVTTHYENQLMAHYENQLMAPKWRKGVNKRIYVAQGF